jgi:hypothetical protein
MSMELYLFDLPIYRQSEHRFIEDLEQFTEARLARVFDAQGLARTRAPESVLRIQENARIACHAPWPPVSG